ncbi:ribokinase [Streptomyces sp. NBC_01465]|uniref:ribokinase n=1 Tax=Streptomyces sp. NBC_01465 TaxID=2903878 RepID=UPI002E374392|nr:ribokinase [Streptomyces sp. NBC_01465]
MTPTPEDLSTPRTGIAVFGSTNMDHVVYVDHPPARSETVTGHDFRTIPGGKGANQAVAAARAGAREVTMIGAVGNDPHGAALRTALTSSGVDTDSLRTVEGLSGTAHIVVDATGGRAIAVIPGANSTVSALAAGDEAVIASAGTLLLQLELPLPGVTAAAEAARRNDVRTILTPSPAQPLPPELLAVTDLLIPNQIEAQTLTGHTDPHEAAAALLAQVPAVLITLGVHGSLYAARDAEPLLIPAPPVTAVDATGARDAYVGALAVALGEGRTVEEAMNWATAAAALCVQEIGAAPSMPYRAAIDTANEAARLH